MITLSGLQHVAACPGSASLPRQPRASAPASLGHAIHELAATRIQCVDEGPDDGGMLADNLARAHGLSADDAGRLAFLATHLRLPVPAGALAEVPLGYWSDGSVRRVTGGAGAYVDEGQWLSGTLDAVWAEPEPFWSHDDADNPEMCPPGSTLWVYDLKTGDDEHVTPIARNWQLRAGALLAARWTGAQRVIPALCYVNAGECAAWLREHPGEPYEGRWEVGAPLDAAALNAIEVELRAVLARAIGASGDGRARLGQRAQVQAVRDDAGPGGEVAREACVLVQAEPGSQLDAEAPTVRAPLILGPHCDHCPARGACPALAAEALTLARAEGLYLPPGAALTRDAASRLAGLISPARRVLDAVEEALKAHARAHGPIQLADGREWGPALEPVTRYRTAETFQALAAVVGDERANEAFETSTTALRAALDGQPRGAWKRLQAEIEARGGVVPGVHEVFRKRWPQKAAEVSDGAGGEVLMRSGMAGGEAVDPERVPAALPVVPPGPVELRGDGGEPEAAAHRSARAPCPACGHLYSLTGSGNIRAHNRNGGLRCPGSRKPPARGAA